MTPEEQKQLDDNIEALAMPTPDDVTPIAQDDGEGVPELDIAVPDMPAPDEPQAAPVADVNAAFDDGAGQVRAPRGKGPVWVADKVAEEQADIRIDEVPVKIPEPVNPEEVAVQPPNLFEQVERAVQGIPFLNEFMKDMAAQGKLNAEGHLNDDAQPVGIAPDDIEDLQDGIKNNAAGEALLAYLRADKSWKEEVIRGFKDLTFVTGHLAGELRGILDGLERRHT